MRYFLFFFLMYFVACSSPDNPHFETATDFILLNKENSPNELYKYYEYQFNTGAFGYSRVFWSVVKANSLNPDLSKSLIPDGYHIKGWSENNELILEEWEPYYYKSEEVDLSSGMEFLGVKIIVLSEDTTS
jgi:hypothetical protein|tara:strand:+ start:3550 stop:3942 length:393 start_codon:yes stop_codon:yes gene_type:complete